MSAASVAETKNRLSAILATLTSGTEREHIIKNRGVPVAIITALSPSRRNPQPFGFAQHDGKEIDWDSCNAMDAEIAEEFGL